MASQARRSSRVRRGLRRLAVAVAVGALTVPLQAADAPPVLDESDIGEVRAWIDERRDMRLLALGESSHDNAVSQTARNQLILDLARRDLIGLIILESGFAESRAIDAYVRGQGLPDGGVQGGLTNGFGLFAPNLELIEAVRSINIGRPESGRIRLLGMDLSAGGPWGAAPGMAPIDCALEAAAPRRRETLSQRFAQLTGPGLRGEPAPADLVDRYQAAVGELRRSIHRSPTREFALCARIAGQGVQLLAALPPGTPATGFPASAWRSIEARDRAMAENIEQLMPLANGKLAIVVTHASHAAASAMAGPRWAGLERSPRSMGTHLRMALGPRYRSILILTDRRESDCFGTANTAVIASLPDRSCRITVNTDDTQVLTLARATDLVILP